MCLLSTPNADVTVRYPRNPFHIREFTPPELRDLLGSHFREVEVLGQNLGRRYRVAPFLPGHDKARVLFDHVRLVFWKLANRLPFDVKDAMAKTLLGKRFYPSENDFDFESEFDRAHVLLAICRP